MALLSSVQKKLGSTTKNELIVAKMPQDNFIGYNLPGPNQQPVLEYSMDVLQFRNCHRGFSTAFGCSPSIAVGDLVAKAVNATLISIDHPRYDDYPKLFPTVQAFNIRNIWNNVYLSTSSPKYLPEFLPVVATDFNFAYCSIPKRQVENIWNFSIFTKSFDVWTWLALCASVLLVSIFAFSKWTKGYSPIFLATISVVISPAPSGMRVNWGKSHIFILWMLMCSLVTFFYTGEMTSVVLRPPAEKTMGTVFDLERENYSLIFDGQRIFDILNLTMTLLSRQPYVDSRVACVQRIMKSKTEIVSENRFPEEFTAQDAKHASIQKWMLTMEEVVLAEKFLKGRGNRKEECYIGKQLVPAGEVYFAFVPPGNILRIKKPFQIL